MARLASFLRARGYRVYTVPEAATMLFTNGASFTDLDSEDRQIAFQTALMGLQIQLEETFARMAMAHARVTHQPAILLCDRGTMDGSAYLTPEIWSRLLDENSIDDPVLIRDQRYNAVFHLVTAAEGAEQFYTLENNAARLESIEEARELDKKLAAAWNGHPRLLVFDNTTGFEGKIERVVAAMSRLLGLPDSRRCFRKFLLKPNTTEEERAAAAERGGPVLWFDPRKLPVAAQSFQVSKVYLSVTEVGDTPRSPSPVPLAAAGSTAGLETHGAHPATPAAAHHTEHGDDTDSDVESPPNSGNRYHDLYRDGGDVVRFPYAFVRKRHVMGNPGAASYGYTLVTQADGQNIETKRIISARAFGRYVSTDSDPQHHRVRQCRTSFLAGNQYFEVTEYLSPRRTEGLVMLMVQEAPEVVSTSGDTASRLELPSFLEVANEVTGQEEYSAYYLSLRSAERARRLRAAH